MLLVRLLLRLAMIGPLVLGVLRVLTVVVVLLLMLRIVGLLDSSRGGGTVRGCPMSRSTSPTIIIVRVGRSR